MGYNSSPRIPVADQVLAQDQTDRKAGLHAESASATALGNTPGGQYQAQPWRESHFSVSASNKLVTVVEKDVANARARIRESSSMPKRQAVAELVTRVS